MKPIERSKTPGRYYIVSYEKKVSTKTKILRFIVRYLIPAIVVAADIIISDILLFNKQLYNENTDIVVIAIGIIVLSFISAVLANMWFKMITKKETED